MWFRLWHTDHTAAIKRLLIRVHSAKPQKWSAMNNGVPIDIKPWSGNKTIRVTRRQTAAPIELDQLYDLDLECLYDLFNETAHTREPVLPAKSLICNAKILSFLSFAITSTTAYKEKIAAPVVVDALVSIQELSHHLSIREMDFELYNNTGAGSTLELMATGYVLHTSPLPLFCVVRPSLSAPPL